MNRKTRIRAALVTATATALVSVATVTAGISAATPEKAAKPSKNEIRGVRRPG